MANKDLTAVNQWDTPRSVVNGDPDDQTLDEDCHQRHANRAEWLKTKITTHENKATNAHAASAISYSKPSGSTIITSDDVQGAITGLHTATLSLADAVDQLDAECNANKVEAFAKAKAYRDQLHSALIDSSHDNGKGFSLCIIPNMMDNDSYNSKWIFNNDDQTLCYELINKPGTNIYYGVPLFATLPFFSSAVRLKRIYAIFHSPYRSSDFIGNPPLLLAYHNKLQVGYSEEPSFQIDNVDCPLATYNANKDRVISISKTLTTPFLLAPSREMAGSTFYTNVFLCFYPERNANAIPGTKFFFFKADFEKVTLPEL